MHKSGVKKIFISHTLKPDSPFHKLTEQGHIVTGQSLIRISYIPFSSPGSHDAVFFYSQKAIKHFLNHCPYDSGKQYGVMGRASAAVFAELTGAEADIVGAGDKEALAAEMNTKWKGLTVLFPQAQRSLRSLEILLTKQTVINLVVYENALDDSIELEEFDILAFTSPLNVEAYIEKQKINSEQVYAIGSTTAAKIRELTGLEVAYCEEPSMDALYGLIYKSLAASELL